MKDEDYAAGKKPPDEIKNKPPLGARRLTRNEVLAAAMLGSVLVTFVLFFVNLETFI